MGFWNNLLKAEQSLRKRVENAFGQGSARTPLEVRREILEEVESRIIVDAGGSRFPYTTVIVRLQPSTEAMREVFEAAFLQADSLKTDILTKLKSSQAKYPPQIGIVIEFLADAPAGLPESLPLFTLECIQTDHLQKPDIPEISLVVVKGSASKTEYRLRKEKVLIGRLEEVLDREGRLLRKNDVVFLDSGEDVTSTVGRAHAILAFDPDRREFFLVDEASRYGTRIVREGRSIEVPGGNSRGIRLRSGDEIYLGLACVRFELIPNS